MKKNITIILFLIIATTFNCYSQEIKKNQLTIEQKIEKYKGVFQIQVKDSRQKANIPYNIDEIIDANQKENKINYVQLGTMVRVMILPKNTLYKKNDLELFSTY